MSTYKWCELVLQDAARHQVMNSLQFSKMQGMNSAWQMQGLQRLQRLQGLEILVASLHGPHCSQDHWFSEQYKPNTKSFHEKDWPGKFNRLSNHAALRFYDGLLTVQMAKSEDNMTWKKAGLNCDSKQRLTLLEVMHLHLLQHLQPSNTQ